MKEDIYNFLKQFNFVPEIKNKEKWGSFQKYILAGMGGSHLQGDVLRAIFPELPLFLHQDYNLPKMHLEDSGVVVASYSGNTEEVLDTYNLAVSRNIKTIVISKGGTLLEIAKENQMPYIELPQNNIQPRLGLGYTVLALAKAMNFLEFEKELSSAKNNLEKRIEELEKEGEKIADFFQNSTPIIYASTRNSVLANIYKININETAKIPSFYNVFPEVNHNEMTGFDVSETTKELSKKMKFLLLKDEEDYTRNKRRVEAMKDILEKRDFSVFETETKGESRTERVFSSIITSAFASYYIALFYNNNPDGVPMVEEFKKII